MNFASNNKFYNIPMQTFCLKAADKKFNYYYQYVML